MLNSSGTCVQPEPTSDYWIDRLDGDQDLDGVLFVESESFTNPWTREMYAWELQNRSVCHIMVVRTPERPVVGFCAFWLVVDECQGRGLAIWTILVPSCADQRTTAGASPVVLIYLLVFSI